MCREEGIEDSREAEGGSDMVNVADENSARLRNVTYFEISSIGKG